MSATCSTSLVNVLRCLAKPDLKPWCNKAVKLFSVAEDLLVLTIGVVAQQNFAVFAQASW
jgi:hypothetical protein